MVYLMENLFYLRPSLPIRRVTLRQEHKVGTSIDFDQSVPAFSSVTPSAGSSVKVCRCWLHFIRGHC